jgi:hypothetical protein
MSFGRLVAVAQPFCWVLSPNYESDDKLTVTEIVVKDLHATASGTLHQLPPAGWIVEIHVRCVS